MASQVHGVEIVADITELFSNKGDAIGVALIPMDKKYHALKVLSFSSLKFKRSKFSSILTPHLHRIFNRKFIIFPLENIVCSRGLIEFINISLPLLVSVKYNLVWVRILIPHFYYLFDFSKLG